ncbi:MAG: membrane protein insertase YidC [Myxococcota bacterium]
MDRLQIVAIAAAIALLAVSYLFQPPPAPEPAVPAPQEATAEPPPAGAEPPPTQPELDAPETRLPRLTESKIVTLANDAIRVRVTNLGARLQSVELLQYKATVEPVSGPVELVTADARGALFVFLGPEPLRSLEATDYQIIASDAHSVELRDEKAGVSVTRRFEIDDAGYGGRMSVSIRNDSGATLLPKLDFVLYGQERSVSAPDYFLNYSLVASVDGVVEHVPVAGIGTAGFFGGLLGRAAPTGTSYPAPVEWVGVDSQYFLLAAVSENARESTAFLGPLGRDLGQSALGAPSFEVPPGTGVERSYRLFFGPKVPEIVAAVDPRLEGSINNGWAIVRPLVHLFEAMLRWTHDHVVANYGVAIILLTLLVRVVTFPLTQRSMKSMKRFSVIAPQMKELQTKYANDRDKLQEEMMKLYRQKGMNPLSAMGGGCVPILVQMPFMIALYFALQTSIELRHAPFAFWINDLSAPENLFSIAGLPLRLLPLLMGASMLLQQRLTPTPNADPQQKQMMTLMSVVFTFMFYQFPSGLVLYWFVSNLLGIAQQLFVNRTPVEPAK